MVAALALGLGLGFSGGIAPGPLHTLIMTTALQRGFAAGSRVAVAPLLTDAPIVILTVALVGSLSDRVSQGLAIGGGVFVIFLGIQTVRDARVAALDSPAGSPRRDYRRGFLANILNPHPWLFWIAVGAPTLVGFWRESPAQGIMFLVGFYTLLVGSKVLLAFGVARGRTLLSEYVYRRLIVVGGLVLVGFGLVILWDGLLS